MRYDAQGFTVDPAAGVSPSHAPYRVAILGDSFVEATQLPYTSGVAGLIAARAAGSAEVRNFGVSSYSPVLYDLQWLGAVSAFHPTHVIVVLYSNDVSDDQGYAAAAVRDPDGTAVAVPGPEFRWLARQFRRLYVARLTSLWYQRARYWTHNRQPIEGAVGGYLEENPDMTPLTGAALLRLANNVRSSGATFLLSAVPSKARNAAHASEPGREFSDKIREWSAANGVAFIDLVPSFHRAAAEGRPLYFERDIHWNRAGHLLAADAFCRALGSAICR